MKYNIWNIEKIDKIYKRAHEGVDPGVLRTSPKNNLRGTALTRAL